MNRAEFEAFRAWEREPFTAAWAFAFEAALGDVWSAEYPTMSAPPPSYRERLEKAEAAALRVRKHQLAAFRATR